MDALILKRLRTRVLDNGRERLQKLPRYGREGNEIAEHYSKSMSVIRSRENPIEP